MNVKGLAEAVEVFEVVGGVSSTLRAESGRRVPAPLVGREADLARLTAALDSVSRGAAQFVAVGGEAGIGKSRLVADFAEICRARGAVVFGAKAQPYTRATGRRIGLDLLRSYFGLDRDDAPEVVRDKVDGAMRALDPELGPARRAGALAARRARGAAIRSCAPTRRAAASADSRRTSASSARRRAASPSCSSSATCSGSTPTRRTRSSCSRTGSRRPPSSLVTYRPEYDDGWLAGTDALRLHLGALPPDRGAELLDALLGPGDELLPLERLLIERAGGNPFFLEESVHDLVQSGALVGEPGSTASRIPPPRSTSPPPCARWWRPASTACRSRTSACSSARRSSASRCRPASSRP